MSVAKNQHFVPQFYLKGFADDSRKVYAARKGEGGRFQDVPFNVGVDGICSRTYYHEVHAGDATHSGGYIEFGVIEGRLSRIEKELSEGLLRLKNLLGDSKSLFQASFRECIPYAKMLLANLIVRNPSVLNESRGRASEFAKQLISDGVITDEECELIAAGGATVDAVVEHSIMKVELLGTAEGTSMRELLTWLERMDPIVLRAPILSEFITADVPFALLWGSGVASYPDYAYFPVDRKTAILFHDLKGTARYHKCAPATVTMWNQFIMGWCDSTGMVIAHRREILMREIAEYNKRAVESGV